MNRQEAIEILTGRYLIPVEDGADEHAERVNNALDMAIDALNHQTVFEQIKWERDMALQTLEEHGIGLGQKSDWIPVSERLPEEDKDVLVTVHFMGLKQTHPTGWNEHIKPSYYVDIASLVNEEWSSMSDEYKIAKSRHKIIAWMPLPEPYKGGDTE